MPQNTRRDTNKTRKSHFPQLETAKTHLAQQKNLSKIEKQRKNLSFFQKMSGKSHSAKNIKKGLWGFFNIHSVAKYQKMNGTLRKH